MSGFTPGPWKCIKDEHNIWRIDAEDGSAWIARTTPMCDLGTHKAMSDTESDARLIAAAPDLYEALHALVNEPTKAPDFLPSRLWDAARAALAKAEGES